MNSKDHWQKVYQEKSPLEVSWYQQEPVVSLSLIGELQLKSDEAIIDVGGGASTLVDCLLERGFKNLTVLDLSSNALQLARQRLSDRGRLINWLVEDVTEFYPEQRYSLWHDRAVFHFLVEPKDRERYRQTLTKAVRKGGYVIIAAFAIGGPKRCSGLEIVQYDAEKLKKELGSDFELIKEATEKHMTPSAQEQLFGYYVLRKRR